MDISSDSNTDFKVNDSYCTFLTLLSTASAKCTVREAIELNTSGCTGARVDLCALVNFQYSSEICGHQKRTWLIEEAGNSAQYILCQGQRSYWRTRTQGEGH